MPPRRFSRLLAGGPDVVVDIARDGNIAAMTVAELRAQLKGHGLSTAGNKATLQDRLTEHARGGGNEGSSAGSSTTRMVAGDRTSAQPPPTSEVTDGVASLLALGFERRASIHALDEAEGDVMVAADALAEATTIGQPPRKRGRVLASSRGPAVHRRGYRAPPAGTDDRIDRALSQRLYLLERRDDVMSEDVPKAVYAVLGSTGNVYEVTVGTSPSCDCPDFRRRQSPCKHILFVWLRVLRLDPEDSRIWRRRLRAADIHDILGRTRTSTVGHGVRAPTEVRQRYEKAMGSSESLETTGRLRKPLDDDDCPICYEAMNEDEEEQGLLTFCSHCGSNLHTDCMARWQRASRNCDCPFCREPYHAPSTRVSPGSMLPAPSKQAVTAGKGPTRGGYVNLADSHAF